MFFLVFVSNRFTDKEVQQDMKLLPYKVINNNGFPGVEVLFKDKENIKSN